VEHLAQRVITTAQTAGKMGTQKNIAGKKVEAKKVKHQAGGGQKERGIRVRRKRSHWAPMRQKRQELQVCLPHYRTTRGHSQ